MAPAKDIKGFVLGMVVSFLLWLIIFLVIKAA
jgi:tetrahydromethanopterin S-methyltransferase subunit F